MSPRVVVIGGGVAGLSVAYFLRARGADVTVLESNRVGSAASSGNAGWLCPAQAGPLPEPGLTAYGLRSLVDRESALYFAPLEIPRMLTWLARFAARCNARDYRNGVIALTRLGQRTFELAERFAADGVDFELVSGDRGVREIRTAAGDHAADQVVLAAGAWSPRLARQLGFRLPVAPGKGYSFEVQLDRLPQHALLLLDPHVGASPLGDRLRVAGTMEFSGVNARLDHRRIASIVRGASTLLEELDGQPLSDLRTGMRPIAPDGLPIIDRAPGQENVYVATAYSMLGMTLAAPASS